MSDPASEISRLVKPRALPAGEMVIEATAAERAALAARFGVLAIEDLIAKASFEQKDNAVLTKGTISAGITQPCAVTREPLSYRVEEEFSLRFVPAGQMGEYEADAEFELTEEDLDEIEYEGETFDLGEAVAQELGLAIDPYREGPEADQARKDAGIESDEERKPSGPLADALAKLRK